MFFLMSFGHIVQEITKSKDTVDHCVRESERSSFEAKIKWFENEVKRAGGKIEISETNDPATMDVHLHHVPKNLAVRIDEALKWNILIAGEVMNGVRRVVDYCRSIHHRAAHNIANRKSIAALFPFRQYIKAYLSTFDNQP